MRFLKDEKSMLRVLFLSGVMVNLAYICILFWVRPVDTLNWHHSDSGTYINPAESFLRTGVFEYKGVPDYTRTPGYPLFLSGSFKLFATTGVDWRILIYLAQAVVFAVAYPAIYYLGREVFMLPRGVSIYCLVFTMLSGAFISYSPIILSDAMFAVSLIAGVACGFRSLQKGSPFWAVLHILLIAYAAMVRPILAFYPIAAGCMHWAYIVNRSVSGDRYRRVLALAMLLFTFAGVQAPAIRTWLNHGVYTATEGGSRVFYDCLAGDVLAAKGQGARQIEINEKLATMDDHSFLRERIQIRSREASSIFREYPLETLGLLSFFGVLNSVETHWNHTLFYMFWQTWYRTYNDGSVCWGAFPFFFSVLFVMVYGVLYLGALLTAVGFRRNVWVMLAAIIFLIPMALCATNYQGARFRLWAEPFLVLAAARTFWKAHELWRQCRGLNKKDITQNAV